MIVGFAAVKAWEHDYLKVMITILRKGADVRLTMTYVEIVWQVLTNTVLVSVQCSICTGLLGLRLEYCKFT